MWIGWLCEGTERRQQWRSARLAVLFIRCQDTAYIVLRFRDRWHGIASLNDCLRSSVVGRQGELQVAAERLLEHRQVSCASRHIMLWIKRVTHAQHRLCARHEL